MYSSTSLNCPRLPLCVQFPEEAGHSETVSGLAHSVQECPEPTCRCSIEQWINSALPIPYHPAQQCGAVCEKASQSSWLWHLPRKTDAADIKSLGADVQGHSLAVFLRPRVSISARVGGAFQGDVERPGWTILVKELLQTESRFFRVWDSDKI